MYGFHSLASWGGSSNTAAALTTPTSAAGGASQPEKDYTTQMIEGGGKQSHRVSPYRPGHGYYGSIGAASSRFTLQLLSC